MGLLGLDIPKWEGPTICESSTSTSESLTDVKPSCAVKAKIKKDLIKEERKREAAQLTDSGNVKEEAVSVKRERADSPVGVTDEK